MSRQRVVIIGAGHNGLVCAAYLAAAGAQVSVLERRPVVGGACVTEESWPGYQVSRAAYVVSLFRPAIVRDLDLVRHGLRLIPRRPSSFTVRPDGRSLVLGPDQEANVEEIGRFSERDARAFPKYEALLERIGRALEPTLDAPPPRAAFPLGAELRPWWSAVKAMRSVGRDLPYAARMLLGPAREFLEEWFDSDPLRSTLATDAVIGAFASPSTPGTGYVLCHHVMGAITGKRGVWAYVRGGMGGLSTALATAATARGAEIRTGTPVSGLRMRDGRACGVVLEDGEEIPAQVVVSCADPRRTFELVDDDLLPEDFRRALRAIDYRSPVVKMNLALRDTPRFAAVDRDETPLSGTIHIGAIDLDSIDRAFEDARAGRVSDRPLVELTIPSMVDEGLAPPGHHVASVFAQYAPALPADDPAWPRLRDEMRDRVFGQIDEVAPGFSDLVEHCEVLAAPDLESVFGLSGGNIFHGAMTLDHLLFMRPVPGWDRYRTPVPGLYLCGSGTHPGGGVMGAPGRNAAREILRDR